MPLSDIMVNSPRFNKIWWIGANVGRDTAAVHSSQTPYMDTKKGEKNDFLMFVVIVKDMG